MIRKWLLTLPCVIRGEIYIDVRGVWPIAIKGLVAEVIQTKDDMINFVIYNVD